jgi:hypothetical protein
MARNSCWKIIFNGCLLPEIFYNWDQAKAHLRSLEESSCATYGRIVGYDDETGEII